MVSESSNFALSLFVGFRVMEVTDGGDFRSPSVGDEACLVEGSAKSQAKSQVR